MPKGIAVSPAGLREISAKMNTGATDVQTILSRLEGDVAPVRSEWAGTAQVQFNTLWDKLQRDASGLHSALTGIAKLTANAATAYEAAEQSIVNSFDEFRVGRGVAPALVGVRVEATEVRVEATEIHAEFSEVHASTAEGNSTEIPVAPVIEAKASDEASAPVEQPKGGNRSPWARFATKAAHATEAGDVKIEAREARRRERRFKAADLNLKPGTRLCRLCFTVVVLKPEYIESTDTRAYVHCPHCTRTFPIRHSDAEAIIQGQMPLP